MKISEIMVDFVMSTRLFEMAYAKRVALDKVRYLQDQIAEHLIRIVMFETAQSRDHWFQELNAWLYSIQNIRIKSSNKPLDQKTLMNLLFDEPLGSVAEIQDKLNYLFQKYPGLKIDQPHAQIIHKKLFDVIQEISWDIEHRKFQGIQKYF